MKFYCHNKDISYVNEIENAQKWQKEYTITDYFYNVRMTFKETDTDFDREQSLDYSRYGGIFWHADYGERQGDNWVGMGEDFIKKSERIRESKLGDHGVSKYDHLTGRFNSIDPLWSNYLGWSPYMYSANSPIHLVDLDGNLVVYGQVELRGAATLMQGSTSLGIMIDCYTVSVYNTWSIRGGLGLGGAGGIDIGGSFARNVDEMYGYGSAIGAWVAFGFAGFGIDGNSTDPNDRSGSLGLDISPVGYGFGLGIYYERSYTVPLYETNFDKNEDAINEFFNEAEKNGVDIDETPEELKKRLLDEYNQREDNSVDENSKSYFGTCPSSSASGIGS